ncbi:hypothetical protein PtB15_12B182 [Puccinia triticina]|nr:hypothetical protein PtB15_12B182 [Puccinia triticina]
MDLAGLRAASKTLTKCWRMTKDMKDELEDMYYDFQCDIIRLAISGLEKKHYCDLDWTSTLHQVNTGKLGVH